MEAIENLRRATDTSTRPSAIQNNTAAINSVGFKVMPHIGDIFALPCDGSDWQPIQDLDPTSGTFGLFYDIEGVSRTGQAMQG